jgi:hypothetical protein
MSSVLTSPPSSSSFKLLGGQHLLQLGRRLAGLGAVRLVGDHREALALGGASFHDRLQGEGEGLDGADHDLLAAGQGLGQGRSCCRPCR